MKDKKKIQDFFAAQHRDRKGPKPMSVEDFMALAKKKSLKFDPNQPRDEIGRWTDTGASADAKPEEPKELTEKEQEAITKYSAFDYEQINKLAYLYHTQGKTFEELEEMNFRGVGYNLALIDNLDSGLDKLPGHKGEVLRSDYWTSGRKASFERNMAMFEKGFQTGQAVNYPVYMSTTQRETVLESFGGRGEYLSPNARRIVYVINSKNGKDISKFSAHEGEKEVLFKRNTKFKVDRIWYRDKTKHNVEIYLTEQVGDETEKGLKFDPNQPRDEIGRWTDTGASASPKPEEPKELNIDEKNAIIEYTDTKYVEMNKLAYLYFHEGKTLEELEEMDMVHVRYNLGLIDDLDSALDKLPGYKGEVLRVDKWDTFSTKSFERNMAMFEKGFETGQAVNYPVYMSTTADARTLNTFGGRGEYLTAGYRRIVYVIKSKNGKDISKWSKFENEAEVLFKRNTKFKVTDIQYLNHVRTNVEIFLEEQ